MGQQQTHFLSKTIKYHISDQIAIADLLINVLFQTMTNKKAIYFFQTAIKDF